MDKRGRWLLLIILLVTVLGLYLGRYVKIETDLTGYSLASSADLEAYERAQEAFHIPSTSSTLILLENDEKWNAFQDFLLLDSLANAWQSVTGVSTVSAITNVVYPRQAVTLVKREKFLNLSSEADFQKRYADWPAYADITTKFISRDQRYALLFLSTASGDEVPSAVIQSLTRLKFPDHIQPLFLQNELIEQEVKETTRNDSIRLALMSTLLILLTFYLLTKSLKGLFYILLMIGFNLGCTLLFMLLSGIPFTIHIITVPCIIIVLSFTDIMHVLYHQRKLVEENLGIQRFRKKLIGSVQLPMLMTSLTNIMGFLVFLLLSENRYLFNFALVSLVGVSIAFLSTRFLFMYTLVDYQAVLHKAVFSGLSKLHDQWMKRLAARKKIIIASLSGVGLILIFLTATEFRIDSAEEAMSTPSALTQAREVLNQHFFGDKQAEVILRSEEGIWSDHYLALIDSLENHIENLFKPIYLESPALVVKRYRRFQRNGHPKALSLPVNVTKGLKEDLNRYADSFGGSGILSPDQNTAKISFGYRNGGLEESRAQYSQLEKLLKGYEESGLALELTGRSYLGDRGTYSFTIKIIIGLLIGIVAASILTMIFLKSLKKSIMLIFVNLFPVATVLVVMLLAGIAITPLTLFFLSLLAGICVDDSIYIVTQARSSRKTVHIFPIIVTSAVLAAGFMALGFSAFAWVQPFSWIFLLGIVLALIMDLLVLPVLMPTENAADRTEYQS